MPRVCGSTLVFRETPAEKVYYGKGLRMQRLFDWVPRIVESVGSLWDELCNSHYTVRD